MHLHIHFGIHRTGTTSIHSTLVNNLERFKDQGVLYPELDVNHRHVRTAWQLISKKIDGKVLVDKIKEEATPDTKKIILSSEDFCQLKDPFWLKVLSSNFELTASVYLRRQDLWLESWYNQHIKWPWDKRFSSSTPEFFLSKKNEFYWLDYQWLLSQIEFFIPREKIYVQVMEKSSVKDTTIDFCSAAGIDYSNFDIKKPKNESLSKCQLDVLRLIDLKPLLPRQRSKILKALRSLDIIECDGSKTVFNAQQRKNILEDFARSNYAVAQNYFSRSDLFQEKVLYPDVNVLSEEVVRQKYLPLIIKQMAL